MRRMWGGGTYKCDHCGVEEHYKDYDDIARAVCDAPHKWHCPCCIWGAFLRGIGLILVIVVIISMLPNP